MGIYTWDCFNPGICDALLCMNVGVSGVESGGGGGCGGKKFGSSFGKSLAEVRGCGDFGVKQHCGIMYRRSMEALLSK